MEVGGDCFDERRMSLAPIDRWGYEETGNF